MTRVQMCTLNQHPLTYFFAGNNMPVRSLNSEICCWCDWLSILCNTRRCGVLTKQRLNEILWYSNQWRNLILHCTSHSSLVVTWVESCMQHSVRIAYSSPVILLFVMEAGPLIEKTRRVLTHFSVYIFQFTEQLLNYGWAKDKKRKRKSCCVLFLHLKCSDNLYCLVSFRTDWMWETAKIWVYVPMVESERLETEWNQQP